MKYLFLVLFPILFSCTEEAPVEPEVKWTKEHSTKLSQNLAIEEEIDIKLFLEQHKDWKMTKTGSGLQYFIYEKGDGPKSKEGDLAEV